MAENLSRLLIFQEISLDSFIAVTTNTEKFRSRELKFIFLLHHSIKQKNLSAAITSRLFAVFANRPSVADVSLTFFFSASHHSVFN